MRRLIEDIYILYVDNKHLLEMANMQPEETGLKPVVFISGKGKAKHGPRIKVSNVAGTFHPDDNFTVTAEHEPRIIGNCKLHPKHLEKVMDWVKLNHDHIHNVWHNSGTMTSREVANGFTKL
jgi:hypothetical protein